MSAEHWGGRPWDWAELAEPSNQPLFAEVLRRLAIRAGTRPAGICPMPSPRPVGSSVY